MSQNSETGFSQPYFIITWVEFVIAIFLMVVRSFTSIRIMKYVAADLHLAIVTFIFGASSMVMLTIGASSGYTITSNDVQGEYGESKEALLFGWLSQFLALYAIGFGKLTIVAFLHQIQGYRTKFRTVLLWSLAGSNMILNIIAAALIFVQCDPAQRLWDRSIPGTCAGRRRLQIFGYVQGSWSAVCDFALALFPILLFARVRAFSIPTKIGLCVLMGCGIFAGACTIVKTVALSNLTELAHSPHQLDAIIVWNMTEMWLVFIVSCIPPTKIFFTRLIKHGASGLPSRFRRSWERSRLSRTEDSHHDASLT